jgi:hypothetical protein
LARLFPPATDADESDRGMPEAAQSGIVDLYRMSRDCVGTGSVAHHRSRRCSPVPGGEIDIEKLIAFDEYGDIIIDRDPNGGRSKAVANHVKVQRGSIP